MSVAPRQEALSQVKELLIRGLARLDLDIPAQARDDLVLYCLELVKWNKKINLVARDTTIPDLVDNHFLDSLTLVPLVDRFADGSAPLLDVGSGAGFPGLVLKTVRSNLRITLAEPRQRRVVFLRHVIRLLALRDIAVAPVRVGEEELPGEAYSLVTGRAVADVSRFLELVEPVTGYGTTVLCMQGSGGRGNIRAGDHFGPFVCREIVETALPLSRVPRFLLAFGKP